jgi:hypothetical protein
VTDWNGERWGSLGFPQAPNKAIKGEGTRERRAARALGWKRKHDEKYRQQDRERRREREKTRRHMCRLCGKVYIWRPKVYCANCTHLVNKPKKWLDRAKLELSVPYSNGQNEDFETRVKQLEALQKEQPL